VLVVNDAGQAAQAEASEGEGVSGQEHENFSLVLGGPLYQLSLRARMVRPTMDLLPRRIIVFAVVTWLPLALLTLLSGSFVSGVGVPFLFDVDAHVKFLISLPLLIGAELLVHRRIRVVVEQFVERGLIAPEDRPRFDALVARAMRLRNSVLAELLLLGAAVILGTWIWRTFVTLDTVTWYAHPVGSSLVLTPAGDWYAYVSLPIARFILLRWYFRLFIWYLFLWGVSRLRLQLNPLHADRAGGLAFVSASVDAFLPVLIAQTAFLSGVIGNEIWHAGATLPEFRFEIAGFIGFLMLLVLAPLGFFGFHLAAARRLALREHGLFVSRYVDAFRQKWTCAPESPDGTFLGTADIQSLADIGTSYEVVRETKLLPFGKGLVFRLAILIALPLLPLTLTMIPLEELAQRLVKLVL
jgi:hypothetical protein